MSVHEVIIATYSLIGRPAGINDRVGLPLAIYRRRVVKPPMMYLSLCLYIKGTNKHKLAELKTKLISRIFWRASDFIIFSYCHRKTF